MGAGISESGDGADALRMGRPRTQILRKEKDADRQNKNSMVGIRHPYNCI